MMYDVYFRIKHPAVMVVEANSEDEARDIAYDLLADMDQDELLERIVAAMEFDGFEVDSVEEI